MGETAYISSVVQVTTEYSKVGPKVQETIAYQYIYDT